VARTEWDVAQALSWIARDRRAATEHLDRLLQIPGLMARLMQQPIKETSWNS
jgi:hypothetical protein